MTIIALITGFTRRGSGFLGSHSLAEAEGEVKTEVLFVRRPVEVLQGGHASVAATPLIIAVHEHGFQGSVTAAMAATRIQGGMTSALELDTKVVGGRLVNHLRVTWRD